MTDGYIGCSVVQSNKKTLPHLNQLALHFTSINMVLSFCVSLGGRLQPTRPGYDPVRDLSSASPPFCPQFQTRFLTANDVHGR
jgi:hypothetical protein